MKTPMWIEVATEQSVQLGRVSESKLSILHSDSSAMGAAALENNADLVWLCTRDEQTWEIRGERIKICVHLPLGQGSKPYLIGTDVRDQILIGERRPDGNIVALFMLPKLSKDTREVSGEELVRTERGAWLHQPMAYGSRIGFFLCEPQGTALFSWGATGRAGLPFEVKPTPIRLTDEPDTIAWEWLSKPNELLTLSTDAESKRRSLVCHRVDDGEILWRHDGLNRVEGLCVNRETGVVIFSDGESWQSISLSNPTEIRPLQNVSRQVHDATFVSDRTLIAHTSKAQAHALTLIDLRSGETEALAEPDGTILGWGILQPKLLPTSVAVPIEDAPSASAGTLIQQKPREPVPKNRTLVEQTPKPCDVVASPLLSAGESIENLTVADLSQPVGMTVGFSATDLSTELPAKIDGDASTNLEPDTLSTPIVGKDLHMSNSVNGQEPDDDLLVSGQNARSEVRQVDIKAPIRPEVNRQDESQRQSSVPPAQVSLHAEPDTDFAGWMQKVAADDEPEVMLRQLKGYRHQSEVVDAALSYLNVQFSASFRGDDDLFLAILSVAAIAELRAEAARDTLNQICAGARRRLLEEGTLPYVEEHFVLTALRALNQPNGRFSLVTVYEEYERIVSSVSDESLDDSRREKLLKKTALRYRRALEHVLFDKQPVSLTRTEGETLPPGGATSESAESTKSSPSREQNTTTQPAVAPSPRSAQELAFRFQPLANRFPPKASAVGPTQAAIRDRKSSEVFRFNDFSDGGDEPFLPTPSSGTKTAPWVRSFLLVSGTIGIFSALALIMMGIQFSAIWIVGGLLHGLGAALIFGNNLRQRTISLLSGVCGGVSLLISPVLEMNLPASMDVTGFSVWGVIVIGLFLGLLHPMVRRHYQLGTLPDVEPPEW